ncbi:MAG: ATP-binding cassette domain-containing protein [Bacteroidales bacterium]|nr:ATP-binding cassette domain-containing protein [Bacteroidales bacterium]
MNILETIDVSKSYSSHKVLDKVSIKVKEGEIFGLLGPNGAGKTTLIRMINQITAPDEGEILFLGERLKRNDIQKIGYLPEERGLYRKMKVSEQAIYLAELKGLSNKEAKKRLEYWFDKFEIGDWWNKRVEELSKGMAQKIQFITTILHEPKLLIFDEPFSGFDPLNANLLKNEILNLRDKGATIIFSTHNMESVEEICDSIALINKSKKILEGNVNEIKEKFKHNVFEIIIPNQENVNSLLSEDCNIINSVVDKERLIMTLSITEGNNADLLSNILKHTNILSYKEILPSMNNIFIETIKNNE